MAPLFTFDLLPELHQVLHIVHGHCRRRGRGGGWRAELVVGPVDEHEGDDGKHGYRHGLARTDRRHAGGIRHFLDSLTGQSRYVHMATVGKFK